MLQISEKTRQEARHYMARDFAAMARALIACDIGAQLAKAHRFGELRRNARARLRILAGEDERAVWAEVGVKLKDEMAEARHAADDAWDAFLEEWRNEQARSAA